MALLSSLDFMIVVVMSKCVATMGKSYSAGDIYIVDDTLAKDFISRGWASPVYEAAALEPAKRTATKKRISKR